MEKRYLSLHKPKSMFAPRRRLLRVSMESYYCCCLLAPTSIVAQNPAVASWYRSTDRRSVFCIQLGVFQNDVFWWLY
jgi:hypothetical protein